MTVLVRPQSNLKLARLSDIALINPRLVEKPREDIQVSFVPMAAMSTDGVIQAEEKRTYKEVEKGYTPFLNRDILVAKITPCFENNKIGQALINHRIGLGSTEFHVIRALPTELNPRFLLHYIRQDFVRSEGQRKMTGSAGQRRVPEHFLADLLVPLPPLPEQRRIAAILDQADALRAKRRAALTQVAKLAEGLFFEMFGDPAVNPKGLAKASLRDLLKLKSGDSLTASMMAEHGRYPVYGGNGISGYHNKYMFSEPKIVIGRVGVYCGCVHIAPPKSWITDNALFVSELSDILEYQYCAHALIRANLNSVSSRFGQPLISGSRVYPVEILVPPRAMQRDFARRISATDVLSKVNCSSQTNLDDLFASLQHRAFRGEL